MIYPSHPPVALVGEWDARPILGPSLRALAFEQALLAEGIAIARVGFQVTSRDGQQPAFSFIETARRARLGPKLREYRAVVAAGSWASLAASIGTSPSVPVWADLFGDPIAEGLARGIRLASDEPLRNAGFLLRHTLHRADAVSVVSRRQRLVALGQLAALSRFDSVVGAPPVVVIPCCLPAPQPARRRNATPRALVSGSANSWIDGELLVQALEIVMDRVPDLEVDITGGGLPGYDDETYGRLVAAIGAARHRERFQLHGWLDSGAYRSVLARASFGIVPESTALERELGSANRCLEWIAEGLPFTISSQSELATDLAAASGTEVHGPGDVRDLARAIERLAVDPAHCASLAANATAFAGQHWSPAVACRPLVDWVRSGPRRHGPLEHAQTVDLAATAGSAAVAHVGWKAEAMALIHRALRAIQRRLGTWFRRFEQVARRALVVGPLRATRLLLRSTKQGIHGAGRTLRRLGVRARLAASALQLLARAAVPNFRSDPARLPIASPSGPPRLVIVSPYPLAPVTAGGTVRLRALVEELSRQAEVLLLTLSTSHDDPKQSEVFSSLGVLHRTIPHSPGSPTGEDLTPPAVRPFRSAALREAIADACAEHAADVVQLEFTELGQYLDSVPAGVSAVLTELDVGFLTARRRRNHGFHSRYSGDRRLWGSRWDWLRLFRYEVRCAQQADLVHMMSESDARVLSRFVPQGRLLTVPNGVTLPALTAPARDPDLVLFVGFFGHSPNRDAIEWFLAEIWPLVLARRPTARLAVVGGMPSSELATRHGWNGVEVLGQVPEVGSWLQRCSVFVAPIRAGSGTRIKLLEAFAHRAPCVSTTLGAEGIDVVDGQHVLIADDASAFAGAVVKLLAEPELAAGLGHAAADLVAEHYTWQHSAEIALSGYHELMARHPAPARPTALADAVQDPAPVAISIVIPTYHGGSRLLQVLEAIAAQRGNPPFEVICVDSGSSEEELGSMRGHGARVAMIPNSAFDHGLTRDLGARLARGRVLVFLNQDAVPASTYWLALLTEPLLRPGRLDAVQGGITEIPERAGRFFWDSGGGRFYYTRETTRWMQEYHGLGFSTINCAIRREAWEAIHFGWAPIMEDKKWQARAARQGRFIGQRHQAAVQHSHDWSSAGLWRRCRSEGEGWALLDRAYTFGDALADLCHRKTWREWGRALLRGELRSKAELAFPIVRPLALWRGGRRVLAPRSPHRPRIRYSPEIVPAEIMEVPG